MSRYLYFLVLPGLPGASEWCLWGFLVLLGLPVVFLGLPKVLLGILSGASGASGCKRCEIDPYKYFYRVRQNKVAPKSFLLFSQQPFGILS